VWGDTPGEKRDWWGAPERAHTNGIFPPNIVTKGAPTRTIVGAKKVAPVPPWETLSTKAVK